MCFFRPRSAISEGYETAHCYSRVLKPTAKSSNDLEHAAHPSAHDTTPSQDALPRPVAPLTPKTDPPSFPPTVAPTAMPTAAASVIIKFDGNVEDFPTWQVDSRPTEHRYYPCIGIPTACLLRGYPK